ncbi:MAG: hypothetical protein KJO50_00880 [Bacteroidia bacterium]|nr:hypothetical protein [Bacteroidia bacterium]MBT8228781.1 hypothetical protein [Bacteroidia bacterium]
MKITSIGSGNSQNNFEYKSTNDLDHTYKVNTGLYQQHYTLFLADDEPG